MQIGWIDFSKEDANKVKQIMQMLAEPGVIDELGIGTIRDAFSDYFFPSTSTIQTKAKYFILVPYILRDTVQNCIEKDPSKILDMIDREQHDCSLLMWKKASDQAGIIGRNALSRNSWVERTPLDIYWAGIKRLGIFTGNQDMSVYSYILQEQEKYKLKTENGKGYLSDEGEDLHDDIGAGTLDTSSFWAFPSSYTKEWKKDLSIELLPEEALFLREKITMNLEGSLYACLVQGNQKVEACSDFEMLYELVKSDVSSRMSELMNLAIGFSRLVQLCYTRYNLLVNPGNETACKNWQEFQYSLSKMTDVDLNAIFSEKALDYRKDSMLEDFLINVQRKFREGDIDSADELITARELNKKRNRRKINDGKDHANDGFHGNNGLDYRFGIARNMISEIHHAEAG